MKKLLSIFGVLSLGLLLSFSLMNDKKVIVIDAGHGGSDLGTNREGVYEKDITLNIAKKIKQLNDSESIEIILTREDDSYPSLQQRAEKINKINPDMVISIHVNSSAKATDKKGVEIYFKDDDTSKELAGKLASKFDNCPARTENLYLLKNSQVPVLMLEAGFISHPDDRNYLASENGQHDIAQKILSFINEK